MRSFRLSFFNSCALAAFVALGGASRRSPFSAVLFPLNRAVRSPPRRLAFVAFHQSGFRGGRRRAVGDRLFLRRGAAARRHRPVAGRQDGLHHRADRQSDQWRKAAGAARRRRRADRANSCSRLQPRQRRGAALSMEHLAAIGVEQGWPQSTRRISSSARLVEFERPRAWSGAKAETLHLDIVDYPGEWLLDLALIDKSYAEWSTQETIEGGAHESALLAWPPTGTAFLPGSTRTRRPTRRRRAKRRNSSPPI